MALVMDIPFASHISLTSVLRMALRRTQVITLFMALYTCNTVFKFGVEKQLRSRVGAFAPVSKALLQPSTIDFSTVLWHIL